ncbi:MAG TPA: hypothetical protein VMH33_09390 [Solirubrobacterales bacterium]|nr:hypothetical protein [Solirubrobacterales bacterium]
MSRERRRWQRGKFSERREPIWDPLLELLPEDIDDFMWMGEAVLTDGTQIQLYKHYWTRRYLCLDLGGRTFVNPDKDRWEEADDLEWLLRAVFRFGETRGDIVRRNEWIESDRVRWARSATKHRISRQRSLHVVRHAGICRKESEYQDDCYEDPRFLFVGPDAEGCPLEVLGVAPKDGSLVIIHAMPLRERYQAWYVEAAKWRR